MNGRLESGTDAPDDGERTEVLATARGVMVEQILSGVLLAPQDYDQDHDEWVVVLAGAAVLEVEGSTHEVRAGDWWLLPAGTRHRVVRTEPGTSWLAVRSTA